MADALRLLDDVTPEWLAAGLAVPVDAIEVDLIGSGEGFMGQLARVHITSADASAPATVIVKLPTADPGAKFVGEMMRVWEREHCFYRDVAPQLDVRVPAALINIADPPCLVLEDLAPAVVGDHVAGASLDQAERAIDVMAQLHAGWFEDPRLVGFDWMPGLDDPSVLALKDTFAMGWPTFLEQFADDLPDRCLRWCERFVVDIPGWIAGHFGDPVTLAHGDFRLNNLFFADDGSVAVIDWQLSMRAPGQGDFVYFCANNLTVDMRRVHERDLLARSRSRLRRRRLNRSGVAGRCRATHVTTPGRMATVRRCVHAGRTMSIQSCRCPSTRVLNSCARAGPI